MKTGTKSAPLPANAWFESHGNQLPDNKSTLGKTNTLKSAAAPAQSSNMAWHAPLLSGALCSALPPLPMPWLAAGKADTKPRGIADHGRTHSRLAKQQQALTQLFDAQTSAPPAIRGSQVILLASSAQWPRQRLRYGKRWLIPFSSCAAVCAQGTAWPRARRKRWLSVVAAVWLRGDALSKGLRQELWRYHQPVLAIGQQLEQCLHMPTSVHCHTELHTVRCPPGKLQLAACQVTEQETRKAQTHTHGISSCG